MLVLAAAAPVQELNEPALAQAVPQVERSSPQRKAILDTVRSSVERRIGIKIIFVVQRIAMYGDWAFTDVHPRTQDGARIDYRKTRYAKDYIPDLDSDTVDVLLRKKDGSWSIVEEAFLPTDVVWENWQRKYSLPRRLFLDE